MTDVERESVNYESLRRLFDRLDPPSDDGSSAIAYSTERLAGGTLRLGKSRNGNPALLIPADAGQYSNPRDRHFANLRLRHSLSLRIEGDLDDQQANHYSVAECVTNDPAVIDWFLRLLPAIYEACSVDGRFDALDEEIARLGELFRLLDTGSHSELTGLWAELALLANARDKVQAVKCWHVHSGSLHDFTLKGENVEVKCTSGRERRHVFSAGQLEASDAVTVASFVVEQADGPSILDLFDNLLAALAGHSDLQHKLQTQIMSAVGRRLAEAEDTQFDLVLAARSLSFVRGADIPRLHEPFPAGVSNVHFTSDLSSSPHVGAYDEMSTLTQILFPPR